MALGISLSWSSPVISKLNGEVDTGDVPIGRLIDDDEESLIGSLLTLGAACGPYAAGYLADRIGRKWSLISVAGLPFLMSFVVLAFAEDLLLYYFGRFAGKWLQTVRTESRVFLTGCAGVSLNTRSKLRSVCRWFCAGQRVLRHAKLRERDIGRCEPRGDGFCHERIYNCGVDLFLCYRTLCYHKGTTGGSDKN